MNKKTILILLVLLLMLTSLVAMAAGGKKPKPQPEERPYITVEMNVASKSHQLIPLVATSGFTLNVALVADDELGLSVPGGYLAYPVEGVQGYIVFEDPDFWRDPSDPYYQALSWETLSGPYIYCCDGNSVLDCTMLNECSTDTLGEACEVEGFANGTCQERWGRGNLPGSFPEPSFEENETYLQFTPDVDLAGVEDAAGNGSVRTDPDNGLMSPNPTTRVFSRSLWTEFYEQPGSNDHLEIPLGPEMGGSPQVTDGYGGGANDDVPGLVLLADSGFGLIYDDVTKDAIGARNLAGFLNQVSYILDDQTGNVKVEASMMAPANLFQPFVLLDQLAGDPIERTDCGAFDPDSCPPVWMLIRVNGGEPEWVPYNGNGVSPPFFFSGIVTLRAFAVQGVAPAELVDTPPYDGVIDSRDLPKGYEMLSNETVVQIEIHYQGAERFDYWFYDLDGNGYAASGEVLPGGAGRITPPPR